MLNLPVAGVKAIVALLGEGNTIPFIARYRKEATLGLDEVAIRDVQERLSLLLELEDRRKTILSTIEKQGALSSELKNALLKASTKSELEDLYLPYKKKRKTRAAIAREKGLQGLADVIMAQEFGKAPTAAARAYVSAAKGVDSPDKALALARDIVAESLAEAGTLRALVRQVYSEKGRFTSKAIKSKTKTPTKFEQYYDFAESVKTIPSHRFLAILRGESEGVLRVGIEVHEESLLSSLRRGMGFRPNSPFAGELSLAVADGYKRLLAPSVTNEVRATLKLRSDIAAATIFGDNLRNLLLAAPLGGQRVIGIDPGLRTGCKCAAIDGTGNYHETITIYLTSGKSALQTAEDSLLSFVRKHSPDAIAIGNGTGGREAESFVRKTLKCLGESMPIVVSVNEAGASVYSASDIAREEFPKLDLTIRGAISIARRLQDPLAELVKIDPKAIGVGQYQHDLQPALLQRKLEEVVESCVNHVGVSLNTASAALLTNVAGIGPTLAKEIIAFRKESGRFRARTELLKVKGLGPKAFEQCAGFLRISGGANLLDSSAIHPERYKLVHQIAKDQKMSVADLIGNADAAANINIARYCTTELGEPTLRDIKSELALPGRDPRSEFSPPEFRDDVNEISDLREGMKLEGVVTNVTAFGAFVDIGVHQDGLVHVSKLSDRYVSDPSAVVSAGQRIRVEVLQIDIARKRISLSAKGQN
ncbi:MAG: RNA-binding transcriptional accessory protein [Kofleriaceae bacterium]|nr:RNA-binding transcriptional accessory protein [Kofleriaceae bacterium]